MIPSIVYLLFGFGIGYVLGFWCAGDEVQLREGYYDDIDGEEDENV